MQQCRLQQRQQQHTPTIYITVKSVETYQRFPAGLNDVLWEFMNFIAEFKESFAVGWEFVNPGDIMENVTENRARDMNKD